MSSDSQTIENIQFLREAFNFYDSDNDGLVKIGELKEAIQKLDYITSDEELLFIMQEVSHTTKQEFDFDEFLLIIARKENQQYLTTKVIEAFQILDDDPSESLVTRLQAILTPDEIKQLMGEIEVNNQGSFDYKKFVQNVIQQL